LGRISQLTAIDPYESNGEDLYAASVVSAFGNLVEYFGTTSSEDAPYPYIKLADQITPQRYDRAVRLMAMVEAYVTQLLTTAQYNAEQANQIIQAFLYQSRVHEEVFRCERAQEIGVRARLYTEKDDDRQIWNLMRGWLRRYYMQPSPVHFVRYVLPLVQEQANTEDVNKEKKNERKKEG
jgi:hypothetical protein